MKHFFIALTPLLALPNILSAKVLLSPIDAIQENYSKTALISKKNILLTSEQFKKVQQAAKTKLTTKIYRIYIAKEAGKILGYGILINRKVRSKNAVVMYLISHNKLLGIEIIAFNEPQEYIPTKRWTEQFKNLSTNTMLHLSREIPTITGATLSARNVTDGSRIAFALYNELLKEK
ncbi:MAG: FMN-binding protein [Epsilonproteobacteria bacterium]|nr:FMN-binding protein [Campylobacterota bacterium]